MRLAALWLLLLGVYAATLTIPATAEDRYAGDEPHHLLAAKSWVQDGDLELSNQYAGRQWSEFVEEELEPSGELVRGRLHEPQGMGMALLISLRLPGWLGRAAWSWRSRRCSRWRSCSPRRWRRRLVPEPWASSAALLAGLSPPALAAATTVSPEPVAATLLARLGAVRAEGARARAVPVRLRRRGDARGAAVARRPADARRPARRLLPRPLDAGRAPAAGGADLRARSMLGSLIFYARFNETFYGGPVPAAARAGRATTRRRPGPTPTGW